ncbi:condensation domain-containing protein, partial [Actinoplanes sp. NPDC020271]|uniref:condensation domain-containing protein n=1 Tax=Actinoplanes sp. NPDC020271 TaxID=3363896 RepID=UPI00378921EC
MTDGALRELSAGQLGVWNAQQLAPASPAYNVNAYQEIRGPLDVDLMVEALRRAVGETDAYRLRFRLLDGMPRQYVEAPDAYGIQVVDVGGEPDPRAAAERVMRQDENRAVDLLREPVSVQILFLLGPRLVFWYQRVHHIAADGYSLALFAVLVARHYNALRDGGTGESPAPELSPLSELWDAEARYRSSETFARDREFWLDRLSNLPEDPRRGRHRPRWSPDSLERHTRTAGPGQAASVRAAAERLRVSVPELAAAAAGLLQFRLTGSRDVVIAVPCSGRIGADEFNTIGMTSNMMPLRLTVDPLASVAEFVRHAVATVRTALRHQRFRYEDIVRELKFADGVPLFGLKINAMRLRNIRLGDCVGILRPASLGRVEELAVNIYDRVDDGDIQIDVGVSRDLPDEPAAARVGDWYVRALEGLSGPPDVRVHEVDLLSSGDRELLGGWAGVVGPVGV